MPLLGNPKNTLFEIYRYHYEMYAARYCESKHKLEIRKVIFDKVTQTIKDLSTTGDDCTERRRHFLDFTLRALLKKFEILGTAHCRFGVYCR